MSGAPADTASTGPAARIPLHQRPWWPWAVGGSMAWIVIVHGVLWWIDRIPAPRTLWGDENTYLESAIRLMAGDPGWWPEPLWPPLYPQFLAGLFVIGGGETILVVVTQSLLLGITAILLGDLTRRITGSRAAGLAAAALTMGYPPLVAFSHYYWPETLHLFLFAALLWILNARGDRSAWCAVAGVCLGLALLCKSLLLPIVPVFLIAAFRWQRPRGAVLRASLVLGVAALTVAPAILANARRTGSPMIANSATFNLWVGLNDVGRESFQNDIVWPEFQRWVASADNHRDRDRILRGEIRELVHRRGWSTVVIDQLSKQYFRLFDASCYLTDQLPGGAAQMHAGAGYLSLGGIAGRSVAAATVGSILLLSILAPAGIFVGRCRDRRWFRALAVFLLYNLALFFWLHVKTRYRIQMLPAAFVGVGCLVAWAEAGWRPRPAGWRVVCAVLAGVVLLWLAMAS